MMKRFFGCLFALLVTGRAWAVLEIEITGGVEGALPIAVVPFGREGSVVMPGDAAKLAPIIANDLARSGFFEPLAERDFISRPTVGSRIRYKDWRIVGADHVVIGRIEAMGVSFRVQVELHDVLKGQRVFGRQYRVTGNRLRTLAHQIADEVFEAITGIQGAFNTRIAYVEATRLPTGERRFQLHIADSDGFNPKTIVTSKDSIFSPAWSPDGRFLAYVALKEGQGATVYIHEVATGQRRRLFDSREQVSAPAWSPDGDRIAVAMSERGRWNIYIVDVRTQRRRQLTRSFGTTINTEPVWTPDGKSIIFTSDLSGNPQIYQVPVSGGRPRRLTFEGAYNSAPDVSPDGKRIALVHRFEREYFIAVQDLDTGALHILTDGVVSGYESPSFAPNGAMLIYETEFKGNGVLYAIPVDGRGGGQRFSLREGGDARAPAWGPFLSP